MFYVIYNTLKCHIFDTYTYSSRLSMMIDKTLNMYLVLKQLFSDLYGKTNEEMTTNDIVMETVNDFRNTLVRAHFEQDDAKKVNSY